MTESGRSQPPHDSLALCAEAILHYLEEVNRCWKVCRQHAQTAAVQDSDQYLVVFREFHHDDSVLEYLQGSSKQLECMEDDQQNKRRAEGASHVVMSRSIVWETLSLRVRASLHPAASLLRVDLIVPTHHGDLPQLPLRLLARALRCHDFLLPRCITAPLPLGLDETPFSIRRYLTRAMPQNLYASQCISPSGAGHSLRPLLRSGELSSNSLPLPRYATQAQAPEGHNAVLDRVLP